MTDQNAETYPFARLQFQEGSAPATPSSTQVEIYAKSDGLMYSKDDAGTETLMSSGPVSASTGLLAVASCNTGASYTTTSSTQADVNSSVAVTFTAPASGNVVVKVWCPINMSAANQNAWLGLRESTTDVVSKQFAFQGQTATAQELGLSITFYVTGISAGSHTYKLAYAVNGGASFTVRASSAATPTIMEVWAA